MYDIVEVDIQTGRPAAREVEAAPEIIMSLFINNEPFKTYLTSPGMEREFAVGHLFSEGIIDSPADVSIDSIDKTRISVTLRKALQLRMKLAQEKRVVAADCAPTESSFLTLLDKARKPVVKTTDASVSVRALASMLRKMNERAVIYKASRGIHSAALFTLDGEGIGFAEDISRHNAVDKVIGAALLRHLDLGKCVVTCTGRPTVTMVSKLVRAGIPIGASLSTPSRWGVKLARERGVTLVLFKGRAYVYSHPDRIMESKTLVKAVK